MPRRGLYRLIAIVCILVFMFSTVSFAGGRDDQGPVIADLLFARPVGFAALVVGTVTYVVTLPVTLPLGWRETAVEPMVKEPYRWTFQRQLGEDLETP